jgi:glycosyltransferase involved in cell wall biosynthesis
MTLRVLFATDHIHVPQGGGGGERNTHELCLAFAARGAVPAVLSSLRADASWLSWRNRLMRKLPPYPEFPRDTICGYSSFRGWNLRRAAEVAKRFRPDIIVVQSTHPNPLLDALATCGLPMAVYFHEVADIDHLASLAGRRLLVLANSRFTATRLHERCGLDCQVVPPLIDPALYATESRPSRLLFVNTVPRKGLEIAFALAEMRPDIPCDFILSWILSPAQVAELQARAERAGNITLHRPTGDMRPFYATARVLLAPSQWEETWGRVVTEAHVNAIPVLASTQGGLPEAVGPGGILVAADASIAEWHAALGRLWDNPACHAAASVAARNHALRPTIQPGVIVDHLLGLLQTQAGNPAPHRKSGRTEHVR